MRQSLDAGAGFSLFEVAIVLVIAGLLLGGLLMPLAVHVETRERKETQATLDQVQEALYGFALANGRLICPDTYTDGDGAEDRTDGASCVSSVGNLPWVDLGVGAEDAWGQRLTYRVTDTFADDPACTPSPCASFALSSNGDIEIRDAAVDGNLVANTIPAVVLSHGKNHSIPENLADITSADERENANGDKLYVYRNYSQTPDKEFDDLVIWLSPNVLKNRMVTAGMLP